MLLLVLRFGGRPLSYLPVSSSLIEYLLVTLSSTHQLEPIRHSTLLLGLSELLASVLRHPYLLSLELRLLLWNRLGTLLLIHPFDGRPLSYPLRSSNLSGFLLVDLNSTHRLDSVRRSKLLQLLDELLASALRRPFPLSLGLQLHLWNHLGTLLLALQFDDRLLSYLLASSSLIGFLLVNLNSILVLVSTDHSMPLLGLDELSVLTLRHPYLPSLELQLLPWNHLDMLLLTRRFDGQLLSYPLASSSLIEYLLVNLNSTHRLGSIRHSTLLQSLDELLVSWLQRPYLLSLELSLRLWNRLDMLLLTLQFDARL